MIIMLFKEINKRDFDKLALKMFSILSSNMEIINSKETINYISAIIDNKALNSMSYMIGKGKIEDIPT